MARENDMPGYLIVFGGIPPPQGGSRSCTWRYDALTDLPNRTHFQARLRGRWRIRAQRPSPYCLDLDSQNINTLGHAVGDDLLKSVAARLRGCVRRSTR
jgi:diguanylate cyclase (GGDEF)-like protein